MRSHCIRCGACCSTASPTLHPEDLDILQQEVIAFRDLFTLRKGEMVHDNVRGLLITLPEEMIKVKTDASGACRFYNSRDKACGIYDHRPIQCREQACWDTQALERRNRTPRITRKELLTAYPSLIRLIESHENRFGLSQLEECVRSLRSVEDGTAQPLMDLLKYDYAFRAFVRDKMGIPFDETDFLFGRPLMDLLRMHGLTTETNEEGAYVVRPLRARAR
ncbi:MAG: YkgJ family cysteine cluster protein [Deltaproteobacteria bacterium]|nr:YkgJ family cysteine cluster protein [Deltaproteobacteria bacterium]